MTACATSTTVGKNGRVEVAVLLVALAVSVLAFTALASRLDFPAPLLLIAVGVAASYVPGVPEIHLEPEVVLFGLLPPLLYAAAIQTSLVDFNANRRADPAALGRPGRVHHPRGRRDRACADPGHLVAGRRSRSAPSSRRRTRSRRRRSRAGSGCHDGS